MSHIPSDYENTLLEEFTQDELAAVREALAASPGVPLKLGNAYESALRKLQIDD